MNALVSVPALDSYEAIAGHYKAVRARINAAPQLPDDEVNAVMLAVVLRALERLAIDQAWTSSVNAVSSQYKMREKWGWRLFGVENTSSPPRVKARDIQRITALEYNMTVDDIMSYHRNMPFIEMRHVAMWLCRQMTALSYPEIGRQFRRDHTSVLSAVRKIQSRVDRNPEYGDKMAKLRAKITSRVMARARI